MYNKSYDMYTFLKRGTGNGQAVMICFVCGYFWLTCNWYYCYASSNDTNML